MPPLVTYSIQQISAYAYATHSTTLTRKGHRRPAGHPYSGGMARGSIRTSLLVVRSLHSGSLLRKFLE